MEDLAVRKGLQGLGAQGAAPCGEEKPPVCLHPLGSVVGLDVGSLLGARMLPGLYSDWWGSGLKGCGYQLAGTTDASLRKG